MLAVTDRESKKKFEYDSWQREWEWNLDDLRPWSPYSIDFPDYVEVQYDVDTANILIGAVLIDDVSRKRVEIFEGVVYYVKPFSISLPAQIYLDKEANSTW